MRRGQSSKSTAFAVVLIVAGVAVFLYQQGLDRADKLASVSSLLVALVGLTITVQQFRRVDRTGRTRSSDPLEVLAGAVREQWRSEERRRRLQDPAPLPVRWTHAPVHLADHWANIRRQTGATEALDLSGEVDDIVDIFSRVPSGRLVVLGPAGAGKSVLTLRFVLDLLERRSPGDPVPVIFALASWRPTGQGLRAWAAQRLAAEYPVLAAKGDSGSTIAEDLMRSRRVLPVLDGFDELPGTERPAALRALNATLNLDDPVLLTSRRDEYAAAVDKARVFTAAAVAELRPLSVADLAAYLPRTTRATVRGGALTTKWDPVLARLREQPGDPAARVLRDVLSTPLMTTLARTAYSDTVADPTELLNAKQFPTRAAVEDHLLDRLIPTVYDQPPDSLDRRRRWSSDDAERWLIFLAGHLHRRGTRDLAWWQLDPAKGALRLVIAFAFAFPLFLASQFDFSIPVPSNPLGPRVPVWWAFTWLLVVPFAIAVGPSKAVTPEPVRPRLRGRLLPFLARLAIAFLITQVVLLIARTFTGYAFLFPPPVSFGVAIAVGLLVGTPALLGVPADISGPVRPTSLLRTDRTTALTFAVVRGFTAWRVTGLFLGPLVILLVWAQDPARLAIGVWLGAILATVAAQFLYGLTRSAWGRFVVAKAWFAITGRLPWSLVAFLEDAHESGVLRQVGGVYQFRHARLQDRLAARAATPWRTVSSATRSQDVDPAYFLSPRRIPMSDTVIAVIARGFGALWVALGIVWILAATTSFSGQGTSYPAIAPACTLLDQAAVSVVVPNPRFEPIRPGDDQGCAWAQGDDVPDQPRSQILLHTLFVPPTLWSSEVREATIAFDRTVKGHGDRARPVAGLGDTAVESVDDPQGLHAKALIEIRAANLVLLVQYIEEDADEARVVEVAEILARAALRKAVGESPSPHGTGKLASTRSLADVPLSPTPPTSRFARYHNGMQQTLVGASWQPGDRTFIQGLAGYPFVFKTPRDLVCEPGEKTEAPDRMCTRPEPSFRLRLTVRPCPATCVENELVRLDRGWTDHPVSWRTHDSMTRFDESTQGDSYVLTMSHVFRAADTKHYYVGVQASVPPQRAAEAQKVVNDIYTQTSGK